MKIASKKLIKVMASSAFYMFLMTTVSAKEMSNYVVDVYKTNQFSVNELNAKFGKQFHDLAAAISSIKNISSHSDADKMRQPMEVLYSGINKMGAFSFLTITPVMYPGTTIIYFTVDVIDKNDKQRMSSFLPKPTGNIPDPDHLIATWMEYQKIGFNHFIVSKTSPKLEKCPAFHCIFGFDDPAFKKYQAIFDEGVPKNQIQLTEILRKDHDENKRAAAAFLLAHIKNGNELINILTPSIYDSSNQVRNNVMRVLAQTLLKTKNADFPIQHLLGAMQFPYETDRNKALYILSSLIEQPRYAEFAVNFAAKDLVDELRLSQPNVHDLSYIILKKISGKNFGDHDYQSWDKWAADNCKPSPPQIVILRA